MALVLKSHQQLPVPRVSVPSPISLLVDGASPTNWSRVEHYADLRQPMAGLIVRIIHLFSYFYPFRMKHFAASQPADIVDYDKIVCPIPASINFTRLVSI